MLIDVFLLVLFIIIIFVGSLDRPAARYRSRHIVFIKLKLQFVKGVPTTCSDDQVVIVVWIITHPSDISTLVLGQCPVQWTPANSRANPKPSWRTSSTIASCPNNIKVYGNSATKQFNKSPNYISKLTSLEQYRYWINLTWHQRDEANQWCSN